MQSLIYEYTLSYAEWYLSFYKEKIIKCPYGYLHPDVIYQLKNKNILVEEIETDYKGKIYKVTNEY